MTIDTNFLLAAIGGAGTVLGTIVATEKYVSSKFKGAVVGILRELEYDREIRHIKRDLQQLQSLVVRLQDKDLEVEAQVADKLHRTNAKVTQTFAAINEIRVQQARLDSAARLIGAKVMDSGSITAILADKTHAS